VNGNCVFCAIVAGTEKALIVQSWSKAIAFTPLNPVTPGHTLIVPREHVVDAVQNPSITALTMTYAAHFARRYAASNILTSVGAAATQSVFHLHVHVVPRRPGDQLMLPWGTTGDPHAPHWCKVANGLARELEQLRAGVERS
jgi:histidine triad (HIT) family protein